MWRAAAVVLGGLASAGWAQQTDWRFAHPNADLRMSVNVAALWRSPAMNPVIQQLEAQSPAQARPQIDAAVGVLRSIERISISARQKAGNQSDALVLVTGSFDAKALQNFFPSKGTSQVRQVGPRAVLIGEGASFTQALSRLAGTATAGVSDELEQSDIWIQGSPGLMSGPQAPNTPPAFKPVRAFSAGINLGEAPDLTVILRAADAAGAAQVLKGFRDLLAQAPLPPQAATMLEQALQMRQDGSSVRLHFVPTPEMLQYAQAQAASGAFGNPLAPIFGTAGGGASGTPASTAAPAPAAPPAHDTGGKIIIYGLEGGPKVIDPGR